MTGTVVGWVMRKKGRRHKHLGLFPFSPFFTGSGSGLLRGPWRFRAADDNPNPILLTSFVERGQAAFLDLLQYVEDSTRLIP